MYETYNQINFRIALGQLTEIRLLENLTVDEYYATLRAYKQAKTENDERAWQTH